MPLAYKHGVRIQRRTMALSHMESCALATQEELGYPDVLLVTSANLSKPGMSKAAAKKRLAQVEHFKRQG
jgi:hypothetical protein